MTVVNVEESSGKLIELREKRAHAYGVHFLPGPRDPLMPNATAELYGLYGVDTSK